MRFLLSILLAMVASSARAQPAELGFRLCEAAIAAAEAGSAVPPNLLTMIARVESGRADFAGHARAWPWTTNINGVGAFYDSKAEAIAAVRTHQARGERSIDVGCMQVNLFYHADAFADLEEAFDPGANARYAERFLSELQARFKTWPLATAAYHSQVQERGEDYSRMVYGLPPIDRSRTPLRLDGPFAMWGRSSSMFSAFPPIETQFGAFARAAPSPATLPSGRQRLTLSPVEGAR